MILDTSQLHSYLSEMGMKSKDKGEKMLNQNKRLTLYPLVILIHCEIRNIINSAPCARGPEEKCAKDANREFTEEAGMAHKDRKIYEPHK